VLLEPCVRAADIRVTRVTVPIACEPRSTRWPTAPGARRGTTVRRPTID